MNATAANTAASAIRASSATNAAWRSRARRCGASASATSRSPRRFRHIWFLKSIPSRLALALDVSSQKLERVIYYSAYIITEIKEENRKAALADLERELKGKLKTVGNKDKAVKGEILEAADTTKDYLEDLHVGQILSENEYFTLSRKFGNIFKAGSGAEAVQQILDEDGPSEGGAGD